MIEDGWTFEKGTDSYGDGSTVDESTRGRIDMKLFICMCSYFEGLSEKKINTEEKYRFLLM